MCSSVRYMIHVCEITYWLTLVYIAIEIPFIMNHVSSPQATVGIWNAGKNNMGFGFNRETWNLIKGCAEVSATSVCEASPSCCLKLICSFLSELLYLR